MASRFAAKAAKAAIIMMTLGGAAAIEPGGEVPAVGECEASQGLPLLVQLNTGVSGA